MGGDGMEERGRGGHRAIGVARIRVLVVTDSAIALLRITKSRDHVVKWEVTLLTVQKLAKSSTTGRRILLTKSGTTESLGDPNHAGDFGSSQVDTLEAVGVVHIGVDSLLEVVGGFDHGDLLVDIKGDTTLARGQLQEGFLGLVVFAVTNEPPRRLGSEDDSDQNQRRPDPLQSKGNSVGPLIFAGEHAAEDTCCDELSNDPAEVDVGCEIWAQDHGSDV
jgi:hypothetical protein